MSQHVDQKTWDRILDAAGRIVNSDERVTVSGSADLDYGLDTLSDELDGIFTAGRAQALAGIRDRGDVIVNRDHLVAVLFSWLIQTTGPDRAPYADAYNALRDATVASDV